MQSGLHALGSGLSRFALALGFMLSAAALAYVNRVLAMVAVQAATAFGRSGAATHAHSSRTARGLREDRG